MSPEIETTGNLDMTCLAARTAAGQVRMLTQLRLTGWKLERIVDDVCLIAGELVANAVKCAPDSTIRVRLDREPLGVLFAVWDSADQVPVVKQLHEMDLEDIVPDPDALDPGHEDCMGGRGLPIVQMLSAQCGVRKTPPHGKWVWSRVNR